MSTHQKCFTLAFILMIVIALPVYAQGPMLELISDARLGALGYNYLGGVADGYSLRSQPSYFPSQNITEVSYGFRPLNWINGLDARWWYTSLSVPIDEHQSLPFFITVLILGRSTSQMFNHPNLLALPNPTNLFLEVLINES